MARTQAALGKWLYLRKALASSHTTIIQGRTNGLTPFANLLQAGDLAVHSARPFHSTSSKQAKPRPAPAANRARDKKRQHESFRVNWSAGRRTEKDVNHGGMFFGCLSDVKEGLVGPVEWMLQKHEKESRWAYAAAIRDGLIPSAISESTYRDVGTQLIKAAYAMEPDRHVIRKISTDVDAVFRIGWMVSADHQFLRGWHITACGLAGAALPCVISARSTITDTYAPAKNNSQLDALFDLAKTGYPPAILLQAKIMYMRGEYEAAAKLLEEKMFPFLSPTARKPIPFEDIILGGLLDEPYRLYALIQATLGEMHNSQEHRNKSDEAIRIAALEYNDPTALVEYASLMMNQNNLEMYEECMSKAATAGLGKACLYLANFYYLTYQGVYPTRGEQKPTQANPNPAANWKPIEIDSKAEIAQLSSWQSIMRNVKSSLNRSMSRADYHLLAYEWYHLATGHGESKGTFMCALLSRELDMMHDGRLLLEASDMDHDPIYAKKMAELKNNWYNKDYEPSVPKKMLPVR
ncbi:uncharacterized protein N7484_005678 [Penicillium longicatenatum]|uniref:uncharacterized protein n=1 Tax=Penicillium longicatenatum TaxID=1561947 RepID=UPI002547DD2A|nr:uncharacterized protein N7484_005678 [Penicillium longicatenatum]KAJ5643171.1 hypothetical protein N7484_005678 [Penicillium longicatenatum]